MISAAKGLLRLEGVSDPMAIGVVGFKSRRPDELYAIKTPSGG